MSSGLALPRFAGVFLLGSLLGCSADEECTAFDYAPPAAILKFEDESGDEICELEDVLISNVNFAGGSAPEDRTDGFNPSLSIVQFTELCEFRVGGWYDRDIQKALEVEITAMSATVDYRPLQVEFDVEQTSCGEPVAREQTVELKD